MLRLFFSVFGEFQTPPIGLEYELKRVESFTMDANTLEMMPSKTRGGDGLGMNGHGLKFCVMCFQCFCVFMMIYFISFDALNFAPVSLDHGSQTELSLPVPQI